MDEKPLDLSSIELDPHRAERLVSAIMSRVEPELRRRRAERGILGVLALWRVPVMAAGALITAVSLGALLLAGRTADPGPQVTADIYDALEIEQPVRRWLAEDRGPTRVDLVTVLEEGFAP